MKAVFLIERLGPYHSFRLSQLKSPIVHVLETKPGSGLYNWKEEFKNDFDVIKLHSRTKQELNKILKLIHPDVVFITGYGFKEMLWGLNYCLQNSCPAVLLTDSTVFDEARIPLKEHLKKLLIQNFDAAITAGSRSTDYLSKLGMDKSVLFRPYDVVDNDFYEETTDERIEPANYFLCVSRLVEKKNLFRLITAFKRFTASDVSQTKLIILGDGPLDEPLKNHVDSLQLSDKVDFKGFLHMNEVRSYYQNAIATVLVSTSEQWGLCINESIAAGTPVIVSNLAGSSADLVEHEISGFVINPYQIDEIVSAMESICSLSSVARNIMTKNARKKLEIFSRGSFESAVQKSAILTTSKKKPGPLKRFFASTFVSFMANLTS